jgi:copper chaperone CopZ
VDSILVSGSLLGWPFAVFKVLSAGFLGVVGGLWAEHLAPEPAAAEPAAPVAAARPSVREGIDHGVDMVRTIWRWLVLGVLLSALITVLVPPQAFAGLGAAGGLLAMLAVLAIATPLYVCATASVPIAAALVAGGFPPGAALVFLMAGPATNVATIGAVRRAFGGRILVAYLTTVVLGSLVLGATFDAVLTTPAAVSGLHPHAGPIGTLSAAVLVALLAFFAFEELRRWWRPAEAPRFEVEGVTCGTCVRKLEGALLGLDGVQTALVTRGEGDRATVAVTGAVPLVQLEAAVEEAGYGVVHPTVEVEVDGVTCGGCVRKLEGALEGTEGVEAACVTRLDEPTRGRASVRTRLSPEAVREMVREAGFEPVG